VTQLMAMIKSAPESDADIWRRIVIFFCQQAEEKRTRKQIPRSRHPDIFQEISPQVEVSLQELQLLRKIRLCSSNYIYTMNMGWYLEQMGGFASPAVLYLGGYHFITEYLTE